MKKQTIYILFIFLLTSCGYQFSGQGVMPQNINSLSVPIFQNETSQSNANMIFTDAFIYEFNKRKIKVADKLSTKGVFKGTIKNVSITSVARTDSSSAAGKKIVVTFKAELLDSDENTVWEKSITKNKEFENADDISNFEYNKTEALKELAEEIAQTIYNDMTSNF